MTWFLWVLAALFAHGALRVVAQVGKPKKTEPTTGPTAAGVVVVHAAIVTGLVLIALGVWR